MSPISDYAEALQVGTRSAQGLALALPKVAGSAGDGGRFSRRLGNSQEFQEYRDYHAGDDLRHLDWSVYGRSDQLVVRRFRQEVSPHLDLVLDGSRSMQSTEGSKGQAAASLSAFFCRCAEQGGFSHSAWQATEQYFLLGRSPESCESWRPLTFDGMTSPGDLLVQRRQRWRPQGVRLLISDLLWSQDPMKVLRSLSAGAVAVVVVQVLSAEEVEPSRRGFLRLQDSESGERLDMLIDDRAIAAYRQSLARHRNAWQEACRRCGALMVSLVAEDVLDAWRAKAAGQSTTLLETFEVLWRQRLLQAAPKA